MVNLNLKKASVDITFKDWSKNITEFFSGNAVMLLLLSLSLVSILAFLFYFQNGLGLSYNDARSHLDIGRRVVEGLKPGAAQLGSVWLPLPHIMMVPTIWNDFMWHSGLAGAVVSMISFVLTGLIIYLYLKALGVGLLARIIGVLIFATNLNILYLQSTAMTELLLIATMTAASFYYLLYVKNEKIVDLLKSAFFIFLSTLTRYDGWFLLLMTFGVLFLNSFIPNHFLNINSTLKSIRRNFAKAEGLLILFITLAGFGIILWFSWNQLIFKDMFYFAFGPYSARAQQQQLEAAGNLLTKGNIFQSVQSYFYALFFNINTFIALLGFFGAVLLWLDKNIKIKIRLATSILMAPLLFNVLALYLGHSVLFIQGINGNTWFNVRYGIMLIPAIAIFSGFLIEKLKSVKAVIICLIIFVTFFAFKSYDAVTIDDARVGSSQKNVTEVSGWLKDNVTNQKGFVLISAASHDAIIFSSGLPMKRFIHEGTGSYWDSATASPDRWAGWIIMRTYDDNDLTHKLVKQSGQLYKYDLVGKYPFADIYQLKNEYKSQLITEPVLPKQK